MLPALNLYFGFFQQELQHQNKNLEFLPWKILGVAIILSETEQFEHMSLTITDSF